MKIISELLFSRLKKEQAELDRFIYSLSSIQFEWISLWNAKRLKLALFTEVAEFANELRTFKIWAKKKPINENKVKEELIDCLCFFLGLVNLYQVDLPPTNFVPFPEVEFNDLLLDFFAKTHSLSLIEDPSLYPHQKNLSQKFTPAQLKTYQEWLIVFQNCCQRVKIEKEEELLSIYLNKKKVNLGRER